MFANEFNTRKILHTFTDTSWGSYVAMHYVSSTWDFQHRGKEYYDKKCKRLHALVRTMVLTQDKNGKIELLQFWHDGETNEYGYCELIHTSPLTNDWYEYHRLTQPVYNIAEHTSQKKCA